MALTDWENEFDKAESGNRSEYMKAGAFFIRVDLIKEGKNQKKQDNFKVEGTIIHKIDPSGSQNIGESVCDMYSANSQFYASELKALAAGISGEPQEKCKISDLVKISNEAQILKGVVLEYFCYDKKTTSGGSITKKYCRGIKTEAEVKEKLSEDVLSRFEDSLKFIG